MTQENFLTFVFVLAVASIFLIGFQIIRTQVPDVLKTPINISVGVLLVVAVWSGWFIF